MQVWLAKNVLKVVAVLILLLVVVAGLGYNSWRNAQKGKAVVGAGKAIGAASTGAGKGAINTLEQNHQKDADTDAKLPQIINNYNTYPAAKVSIDPAFLAAFDRSLCVYRSAANLLQCRGVQQVAPGKVEE